MTHRLFVFGLILAAFLPLAGCVNFVTVKKFTGTEEGFRYSLPRPYIKVTPRADGGIDVQPLMLPDTQNEYVITTFSFLSSYKYDYAFEQGLLKSVTNKQDASALAAQVITNTGTVMKARTDAALEAEKEAAKRRQDAEKAVRDARLEYEQAFAEREKLQELKVDTRDAEVKLARAKAKLDALEGVLATSAFNLPGEADTTKIAQGNAWGPVLYAVIEGPPVEKRLPNGKIVKVPGSVSLKAVEDQVMFGTIALPVKQPEAPKAPRLGLESPGPFKPEAAGLIKFQITSDKQIAAVDAGKTLLVEKGTNIRFVPGPDTFTLSVKDQGRKIEVTIGKTPQSGTYDITPAVKPEGAEDFSTPKTLSFKIER
jgi:hypothetical protein